MHLFTTEELIETIDSGIPEEEREKIVETLESLLDDEIIIQLKTACQKQSSKIAESAKVKLQAKTVSCLSHSLLARKIHLGEQESIAWGVLFNDYLESWIQLVTLT